MVFNKQDLLKQYKKANQDYKNRLVAKMGFPSREAYLQWLTFNQEIPTSVIDETPVEDIVESYDIAIVFDTTGSMSSYIDSVKSTIQDSVKEMLGNVANLKIAIIGMGDYCDMKSATEFGKAYQQLDFTNDGDEISRFVENVKGTAGGDGDEFYELVINKVVNELSWRENAEKSVMIFADANPHKKGYSYRGIVKNAQIDWRVEAKASAEKGIKWDCYRMNSHVRWWEELASTTGGEVFEFNKSENTQTVIEGTVYARTKSTAAFTATFDAAKSMGDIQLDTIFTSLDKIMD